MISLITNTAFASEYEDESPEKKLRTDASLLEIARELAVNQELKPRIFLDFFNSSTVQSKKILEGEVFYQSPPKTAAPDRFNSRLKSANLILMSDPLNAVRAILFLEPDDLTCITPENAMQTFSLIGTTNTRQDLVIDRGEKINKKTNIDVLYFENIKINGKTKRRVNFKFDFEKCASYITISESNVN